MKPIQSDRLLQTFLELTSIDSLSYEERAMADYIREQLTSMHIPIYEDATNKEHPDGAGNVYAWIAGTGHIGANMEPLLLVAHMDTVSPGLRKRAVVHNNGTITSDGTTVLGADDLSAVAVLLEVVRELQEEAIPHRPIELLFTVAEEAYAAGAKSVEYERLQSKEAYVLDVSGAVGTISMQEPTLISFELDVYGKAAHAGFEAAKGINAIAIAAHAISKINQGQIDEQTTFCIGQIQGGEATNIIPEHVKVKGEVRSIDHQKAVRLVEEAIKVFQDTAQQYRGRFESSQKVHLHAYEIEEKNPVVLRYIEACRQQNIPVQYVRTFGGSDNNQLRQHGINGIVIANGMHNIHTKEEYTSINELVQVAETIKRMIIECS